MQMGYFLPCTRPIVHRETETLLVKLFLAGQLPGYHQKVSGHAFMFRVQLSHVLYVHLGHDKQVGWRLGFDVFYDKY